MFTSITSTLIHTCDTIGLWLTHSPELWLGPSSGLVTALSGCWFFLRRFERLQDEMFHFFRMELHDCQTRYTALVTHILSKHQDDHFNQQKTHKTNKRSVYNSYRHTNIYALNL